MKFNREDLSIKNTNLPVLTIQDENYYLKYEVLGKGFEGRVYNYNDEYAIKIYNYYTPPEILELRFEKLEAIGIKEDENAAFQQGLVNIGKSVEKRGCYQSLVKKNKKYPTFFDLYDLPNDSQKLPYIIEASQAVKRFHQEGFIIGDIGGDNILISQDGKVIFIDTDNWAYKEYVQEVIHMKTKYLQYIYEREIDFLPQDIDRFLIAFECMQLFLKGNIFTPTSVFDYRSSEFFKYLVSFANLPKEVKDGLAQIFSDSVNKPYIHEVLKEIDPEREVYSKEKVMQLNIIR